MAKTVFCVTCQCGSFLAFARVDSLLLAVVGRRLPNLVIFELKKNDTSGRKYVMTSNCLKN